MGTNHRQIERAKNEPWEIGTSKGITKPAGEYSFGAHGFMFMSSQSRPISVNTELGMGSFYSGTRQRASAELTWRKDRHLTTSLSLE